MNWTILLGLVLLGCGTTVSHGEVTISACETSIRVKKGDTVAVRLTSQITAGYTWSVASQTTSILKSRGKPEIERKNEDIDGGSEVQVFRFDTGIAGSDTILFYYRRPWETAKPPLKTCKVTVEVL